MNVNLFGILGITLAFVFFVGSFRGLRGKSTSERIRWLLLFALLAMPALMFAAYYLHVIPEAEAFYEFRSWPGTELLVAFVGGFAGVIATFLPRLLFVFPFLGMAGIVIGLFIKPVTGPLEDSAFRRAWRGSVCLQSTSNTCGPASVATIIRNFGIQTSEIEVARAAYSYRRGTEAWYLARHVRRKGLNAKFRFEKGFSPDIGCCGSMMSLDFGIQRIWRICFVKSIDIALSFFILGRETHLLGHEWQRRSETRIKE